MQQCPKQHWLPLCACARLVCPPNLVFETHPAASGQPAWCGCRAHSTGSMAMVIALTGYSQNPKWAKPAAVWLPQKWRSCGRTSAPKRSGTSAAHQKARRSCHVSSMRAEAVAMGERGVGCTTTTTPSPSNHAATPTRTQPPPLPSKHRVPYRNHPTPTTATQPPPPLQRPT